MPLSPQWRRPLEILAAAGLSGATYAELMAHGFSAEMMASLVLSGSAVTIVRMRITNAGRRAIEG
jgi:hypothetical protein